MTDQVLEGLRSVDQLVPGAAFFDLKAGLNQDAVFGRAELGKKFTPNISAFGFGQLQKDFARPGVGFEVGAGLRGTFP